MSELTSTWRRFLAVAIFGVFVCAAATAILLPQGTLSQSAQPMTGWLWTDTTGWVSLNCSDLGTCGAVSYSVVIDNNNYLAGYGWSDNVGWIKFGGLSSFPSGSGTTAADARLVSNALSGWIRACAGTASGTCSSMTSRTDGWDGWVSLSGSTYQVTKGSGDTFNGCTTGDSCAWGSEVNGWVDWSYAEYQCTPQQSYCDADGVTLWVYDTTSCGFIEQTCAWQCPLGGTACISPVPSCEISANPPLVASGATTTITWSSSNADSCAVSGNGDNWSGLLGSEDSSPITGQTTYTQTCIGPDSVSTCNETTTINPSPQFQEI